MVVHGARRFYTMGQETGLMRNVIYRPISAIGVMAFEVRSLAGPMDYSRPGPGAMPAPDLTVQKIVHCLSGILQVLWLCYLALPSVSLSYSLRSDGDYEQSRSHRAAAKNIELLITRCGNIMKITILLMSILGMDFLIS